MRIGTRAIVAIAGAAAMTVGVAGVSYGVQQAWAPGVPHIHIHIPHDPGGSGNHSGGSNCGNGVSGLDGGSGANGMSDGSGRGGKGAPGGAGAKGGRGAAC